MGYRYQVKLIEINVIFSAKMTHYVAGILRHPSPSPRQPPSHFMGPGASGRRMGPNYISDHVIDIIQFISSHCYLSNLLNLTGQCLPNLTFH